MTTFLSIDFEDIAHDFKRDFGLWETGPLRVDALWRSYEQIDRFYRAHGGTRGQKGTFFCTGVIADQAPDLIARIAADGHEVACHYHFHDEMDRQDAATVDRMLGRAKDALEAAAGQPVLGFRAPKFRIDRTTPAQYLAVQRHFAYDSSFPATSRAQVEAFRARMGLTRLPILPVVAGRVWGLSQKSGGTYLKLFPLAIARRLLADGAAAGMAPHIYLHPYEFTASRAYALSADERRPMGALRSARFGLRQMQWHVIGNRTLPRKLARLIGSAGLGGRLCDNLEQLAVAG